VQLDDLDPVRGVRHRTVAVPGVDLHVAEAGDGPPLLLLHGWPQHWWSWRRMIPALARSHRVIVPDLRGLGWSGAPPAGYDKRTLAGDIVALLDSEGLDRVLVMGHDWGGVVAFLLALEHGERVERMVALDIAPPWRPRPRLSQLALPVVGSYQFVLGTPGLGERVLRAGPGFVRLLLELGSGPDAEWSEREVEAYAAPLREPARAHASSLYYRTFLTRELVPFTRGRRFGPKDLQVPSLAILGGASFMSTVLGVDPAPNLRVETLPGAGHFLPEEAPDEVLALAAPFLASGDG
jgi:pimeloyl-ACP methyl ester carboxylesterase